MLQLDAGWPKLTPNNRLELSYEFERNDCMCVQVTEKADTLKGKTLCGMPCNGVQIKRIPRAASETGLIEVCEDGRLPLGEMGTGIRSTGQVVSTETVYRLGAE